MRQQKKKTAYDELIKTFKAAFNSQKDVIASLADIVSQCNLPDDATRDEMMRDVCIQLRGMLDKLYDDFLGENCHKQENK